MVATLMTVAGVLGVVLVLRGATASPPPAPTAQRPFSIGTPPRELLPGDTLPRGPGDRSSFAGAERVFIPSLGVDAPIDAVGARDGRMLVPTDLRRVGRWQRGAGLEADAGTLLLVGHVNYGNRGPGVLHDLHRIEPGAVVVTTDSDGTPSSWRVVGLESVHKTALPSSIFTRDGERQLVLVTCGGALVRVDGPGGGHTGYADNTIVRAVPA